MDSIAIIFLKKYAITIISSKIYEILTTLYSNDEVQEQLVSLDIEASIKNMELLIDDLHNSQSYNNQLRKTIQCMLSLINEQCMNQLNKEGLLQFKNNNFKKEYI